jgi:hypothetical protein
MGLGGIGGGNGSPSARRVWSIAVLLPAKRLTEWTTGSRIKAAKQKIPNLLHFFSRVVALLGSRMRRGN